MKIGFGFVIAVAADKYECDVMLYDRSRVSGVTYCKPYFHPEGGGYDFIPEVNASCVVLFPDNQKPLILTFAEPTWNKEEDDPRIGAQLVGGDQRMWAKEGNEIVVYRNGTIVIRSTPSISRVLSKEKIADTTPNYELRTNGGTLSWLDIEGETLFKIEAKETPDGETAATLKMGKTKQGIPFILEIGDAQILIDKSGNVSINAPQVHLGSKTCTKQVLIASPGAVIANTPSGTPCIVSPAALATKAKAQ